MAHTLRSVLHFLFRRQKEERELDAEVRYHLERQIEENRRQGMSAVEARLAAKKAVGGVEQVKEECRDVRLGRAVEATLQDIRYGLRVLFKNPGFACTAILTLALGIGINTAIFSVVYGMLLRPLPYRQGGQLVVLHQVAPRAHLADVPFSAKEITDYREQNHTLQGVAEHHSMFFLLLGKDWAQRVQTAVVSANFFELLGVKPLLGRTFVAGDEQHNADAVLILSYKYWQTQRGGDPNIVGKVFQMNNRPQTVIGVLPPFPQYPIESDVYMPTSQCPFRSDPAFIANRNARMMTAFARLKPGVSGQQAQSDLSTIAGRLQMAYPESYPKEYGYGASVIPLRDDLTRRARLTFLVLLGATGLVLLIACANVANLLLARLLKLERELAVRSALGATKLRLMRQLLTESVILSLTGGALGVLAAPLAVRLLANFAQRFSTRANEVKLDAPILLFALGLSLLTGLLFGLAPAFSSVGHTDEFLKEGMGRSTAGVGRQRFRATLVIAQVAVSFMLLIGAGLMIRSFWKLQQVNPGFAVDHVLTMRLSPNFSRYSAREFVTLDKEILRRVDHVGAIQSAALASSFPFDPEGVATGPNTVGLQIEGRSQSKGELPPIAQIVVVSAGYFQTLRQPLLEGRFLTEHDIEEDALPVVVINQAMARHRWQTEDPIGKRIKFDDRKGWAQIVGVVGDAREYGLERSAQDELYVPGYDHNLVIRTAVEPMAAAPLIQSALHDLDPQLAIDQVNTIAAFEQESFASPRLTTTLLGLFAVFAVLISAGGVAGTIALAVSQRTRELGIRVALGASRPSLLRMVLRQGLGLALAGTLIGFAGALVATRLLSSLLYATSPTDAFTYTSVAVLFLAVAAVACLVPARQVTAIDPLIALRQE